MTKKYPFKEGETYYILNECNFVVESVWDRAAEENYDALDPEDRDGGYFRDRNKAFIVALLCITTTALDALWDEDSPFHPYLDQRLKDWEAAFQE